MKKQELKRLKTVIENDRLSMTNENIGLITHDVTAVLEDYFALSGMPEVTVTAKNCEYIITVNATATGIKSFSVGR